LAWQRSYLSSFVSNTVTQEIDIACPENNGIFTVYDLGQNLDGLNGEHADRSFWGCAVYMKVDTRFIIDWKTVEPCKARVSSNNIITVTKPAWEYDHLKNRDAHVANSAPSQIIAAMDDAHDKCEGKNKQTSVRAKASRQWEHVNLVFPEDHVLSAQPLSSDAGEDEWLPFEVSSVVTNHPHAGEFKAVECVWTVCRMDLESRKKGKSQAKSEESIALEKLRKLGLAGNSPKKDGG